MGTPSNAVPALFGRTRTGLLAVLYGHSDESFHLRQLARLIGGGIGALQRELANLTAMGLIIRTRRGNQVLYRANPGTPIFSELRALIAKTAGIHDAIRAALAILGTKVEIAFVYGSVARQQERANSDVDLMIVGEATFSEAVSALAPAQKVINREINPTVLSALEFRSKIKKGDHFLNSVLKEKNLFVIGTQHELARLAAK